MENGASFLLLSQIKNSKSIPLCSLTLPFNQMSVSAHFCFQSISKSVPSFCLSQPLLWLHLSLAIAYLPSLTSLYLICK